MRSTLLLLTLALPLATPARADAPPPLDGTWRVTAVTVDDSPVQALVENDPSLLGRTLSVSGDSLIWSQGSATEAIDPSIDNCPSGASFAPSGNTIAVQCGDDIWGPPGSEITLVSPDEIIIAWYDGGNLTLTRQ